MGSVGTTEGATEAEKKLHARAVDTREAILQGLRDKGYVVETSGASYSTANKISLDLQVSVFDVIGDGKLRVTFGCYQDRHGFPEPKAGFDILKLVAAVAAFVDRQRERRDAATKRETKVTESRALATKLNAEAWGGRLFGTPATITVDRYGDLKMETLRPCTEEQARKLLALAKELFAANEEADA